MRTAVTTSESISIPSRLEAIDDARRWLAEHARNAGLGDMVVFELELAMTEALSNVIRHAYEGDVNHEVDLSLTIDAARLELSLGDRGRPFDEATYSPPTLDVPGAGGYGIHMIAELVDEVHREPRTGGGNVLSLVKYRKGAEDA